MLGVCCGIPLLLRRDMQPHIALMLLALLLLVLAIFVPGLLAAIRLTLWLDGDVGIHSGMIMVPYLVALWLILVVIIAAIGFVIFGARRIGRREFLFDEGDDDAAGLAEILAKAEAPTVLVRESSTLFRRVSAEVFEKYKNSGGDVLGLLGKDAKASDAEPEADGAVVMEEGGGDGGVELVELGDRGGGGGGDGGPTAVVVDGGGAVEAAGAPAEADNGVRSGGGRSGGGFAQLRSPATSLPNIADAMAAKGARQRADHDSGDPARDGLSDDAREFHRKAIADGWIKSETVTAAEAAARGEGGSADAAADGAADLEGGGGGEAAAEGESAPDMGDGSVCWICWQDPPTAVLMECGHGGLCTPCAERCWRKRPHLCPMCRQRITMVVQVGEERTVDGQVLTPVMGTSGLE